MGIEITKTEVYGLEAAFRCMRNPYKNWDESDSWSDDYPHNLDYPEVPIFVIGSKDMKLAQKLIHRGGDHRKFLRLIVVWADITLPRYLWAQWDTYKVGMVRSSCSTMNRHMKKKLTQKDFIETISPEYLDMLNNITERRVQKALLPEGYLQKSTICTNYEVLIRMYMARKKHRLVDWQVILNWIENLPGMKKFIERE